MILVYNSDKELKKLFFMYNSNLMVYALKVHFKKPTNKMYVLEKKLKKIINL